MSHCYATQGHDSLNQYILHMADNTLVLGQRLCELCTHAPILEEETALMNTSLDLFGQARNWLDYAVARNPQLGDCDALAMGRDERHFLNLLLCEQDNGNFADTMARQYLFDVWHRLTLQALCLSQDSQIAAIAAKSIKEVDYHEQRSRNWVIRLGDGTQQSHDLMQSAINDLWSYSDELFVQGDDELQLVAQGIAADQASIEGQWRAKVSQTMAEATLTLPTDCFQKFGGKQGEHSEPFGLMLAEMQSLYRAHPGAVW